MKGFSVHFAAGLTPTKSLSSSSRLLTETIFPRINAHTYYAHPRARVMSFSALVRLGIEMGSLVALALQLLVVADVMETLTQVTL